MAELCFDCIRASTYGDVLAGVWHSKPSDARFATLGLACLFLFASGRFVRARRSHRNSGLRDAVYTGTDRSYQRAENRGTSLPGGIHYQGRCLGEKGKTALILAVHTHRYTAEVALVRIGQSIKQADIDTAPLAKASDICRGEVNNESRSLFGRASSCSATNSLCIATHHLRRAIHLGRPWTEYLH